jgi:hypothetical protein
MVTVHMINKHHDDIIERGILVSKDSINPTFGM